MSRLDLVSLRAIVELSETRNFRIAAQRLAMTQSALSLRLKRLEDRLGIRLFERSRAGVALSEAGLSFLPYAKRVIGEVAAADQAALRIGIGEEGPLRLGYTPASFFTKLPTVMREFMEARPAIDLMLDERLSKDIEDALISDELDIGILHPPVSVSNLELWPLPAERYVIVVPRDDKLADHKSVPITALAERELVLTSRRIGPVIYSRVLSLCEAAGFTPRIRQEVTNSLAVLSLVAAGYGTGLVIGALARTRTSDLAAVEIDGIAPELPLALAVVRGRPRSAVAQSFVNAVVTASKGGVWQPKR